MLNFLEAQRDAAGGARQRLTSVVDVEGKRGDHDTGRAGFEGRLEQPSALVMQDLVAPFAWDDLGDQHHQRRVIGLHGLDVLRHAAHERWRRGRGHAVAQTLRRFAIAAKTPSL